MRLYSLWNRLVIHILQWWLSLIHVSSLHSIVCHCFLIQLRCSCAQTSWSNRFFFEIEDFLLAIRLKNSFFLSAKCMTSSETFHFSFQEMTLYDIYRFFVEAHTNSIRNCRESTSIVDFRSRKCRCEVSRTKHAYWIWRSVIFMNSTILEYFHSMLRRVWAWSRKSRVNFFCLVDVVEAFILI